METTNNTVQLIGVMLLGVTVGAALGILFAPCRGSYTRCKLISKAKDTVEDLKQKMQDEAKSLRAKADQLENLAEDKIEEVLDTVKLKAESLKYQK